jgi:hypothetical protein
MTTATMYEQMTNTYQDISKVINKAQRTLLEYEVFISDAQHSAGEGNEVSDVQEYFSNLIKQDEKNNND